MTEIKAFLRPERMDAVVHGLMEAGVQHVTVIPVKAVGERRGASRFQIDETFFAPYADVHKLELVCHDEDVERAVQLICELGRTGEPGDGIAYVSGVDRIVKIRTGDEGRDAVDKIK